MQHHFLLEHILGEKSILYIHKLSSHYIYFFIINVLLIHTYIYKNIWKFSHHTFIIR